MSRVYMVMRKMNLVSLIMTNAIKSLWPIETRKSLFRNLNSNKPPKLQLLFVTAVQINGTE